MFQSVRPVPYAFPTASSGATARPISRKYLRTAALVS